MTNKFNVGDVVRRIDPGFTEHATVGRTYTVLRARGGDIYHVGDDGEENWFVGSYYELVTAALPHQFYVGQRIRCVDPKLSSLTKGRMYMIFDIGSSGLLKVRNDAGQDFYYRSAQFEPWFGVDAAQKPTPKFVKDQWVRCVDGEHDYLTLGKDYSVIEMTITDDFIKVINDVGCPAYYASTRFEPMPKASTTTHQKGNTPMRIKMTFITARKIHLIKELRSLTGSGLREAKDAVECGIIFDLNSVTDALRFAKVVKMMEDTYIEHYGRYEVTEYVPPPRRWDPVESHTLLWTNRT